MMAMRFLFVLLLAVVTAGIVYFSVLGVLQR
jgi:hypothetical protein